MTSLSAYLYVEGRVETHFKITLFILVEDSQETLHLLPMQLVLRLQLSIMASQLRQSLFSSTLAAVTSLDLVSQMF